MKTNVHFVSKQFNYTSDQTSVTCSIKAQLSLDNNPILKAVVKDNVPQVVNMLNSKSAYQLNGDIFFTVSATATYKEGDTLDIITGKHIAEDKAQAKAMEKAHHIYLALTKIVDKNTDWSLDRVYALAITTANMLNHIETITSR